jgi:single-stranded-DNA-specific exonuclease
MSNFAAFKKRFSSLTAEKLSDVDITPKIVVDSVIDISEVSPDLVASLRMLEPFGQGNSQPLFVSRGLTLKTPPTIVGKRHLKTVIQGPDTAIEAIGFDMAERIGELRDRTRRFDFAYIPRMNHYRGVETLQLVIKDFQPTEAC